MKKPKSQIIFFILVVYIFLQFIWWAYMLIELNKEIYTDESILMSKWMMIIGEGLVFLALLIFGFYQINVNLKREAAIAAQQQNFILSVSHELKSPLASLRLIFETISKRDIPTDKIKEISENGTHDVDRLNTLVENILLSARFDDLNFKLNLTKENFSDYINSTIDKLKNGIAHKHKLETSISPNIYLLIDKFNFESIIFNLIENACKYSDEGSTIWITLQQQSDKVTLNIEDEGIGIAENELMEVTKKFYRVGNEETRSSKGTGLGLYIVNYLVKKHGGEMKIKSTLQKGTLVSLMFNV